MYFHQLSSLRYASLLHHNQVGIKFYELALVYINEHFTLSGNYSKLLRYLLSMLRDAYLLKVKHNLRGILTLMELF